MRSKRQVFDAEEALLPIIAMINLPDWNGALERTKEQVISALRCAAYLTEHESRELQNRGSQNLSTWSIRDVGELLPL